MIRILAIQIGNEHMRQLFEAGMCAQWLASWSARHPGFCGDSLKQETERKAVASLAGLYLAARAGARGELFYDENGRPFLKGEGIDLSITHADGYVLCAVGDGRIGLDAERFDRADTLSAKRLSERWFTESERTAYLQAPTGMRFLELWTRKESAVKMSGEGLSALAKTDTFLMERKGEIAFSTWRTEALVVTLCHPKNACVTRKIEWL